MVRLVIWGDYDVKVMQTEEREQVSAWGFAMVPNDIGSPKELRALVLGKQIYNEILNTRKSKLYVNFM